MTFCKEKQKTSSEKVLKWLPPLLILLIIFIVPPAAIAVILAYFTAPLLSAVKSVTKIPNTLATLIVMALMILITSSFIYIAMHGIIEIIPSVQRHLEPFTKNKDLTSKFLAFLEEKIVQYGHALLEYALTIIQTVFQHVFSFFIFLIAYFFALRESGKERFWFLVYFPVKMRKTTKKMLVEASKLIGTFISLEARLMFLTFIILAIGFSLLGFDSPIGMAFLIALVDSVPFLGIGIFIIPMAVFFLYINNLIIGIALISLYLFTLITRQFAESYMWASTFQLRPVHAFFIMASSVYLLGFVGILLTPFLLFAALKIKQHRLFTSK